MKVAVFLLAGCAYRPGSFEARGEPFAGKHVTLDCIDLALSRELQVVHYEFANRCDRTTVLDLATVQVTGRVVYDPRHEIVASTLPARSYGDVRIEYRGPVDSMCLDVGRVGGGTRSQWVCL